MSLVPARISHAHLGLGSCWEPVLGDDLVVINPYWQSA
jgi:hypothetical protein